MFVKKIIEERLSTNLDFIVPLSGGDINQVYKIKCSFGEYIVKYNSRLSFPKMFEKEAAGLDLLRNKGLNTPLVLDRFEHADDQLLILEFIKEEKTTAKFWLHFAEDLSVIHKNSNRFFGLDHDNYIGSLHQDNHQISSWKEFFISKRLQPLIKMAFDKGLLTQKHLTEFDAFYSFYSSLIPVEKPSLLHGDLWSGNLLCSEDQKAVFIDPAVYYGHREVDIAMTSLFGGFDRIYLDHYQEHFPLENGWKERIPIHNLYPNLVHLNLFGSAYLGGIEHVIQRFY